MIYLNVNEQRVEREIEEEEEQQQEVQQEEEEEEEEEEQEEEQQEVQQEEEEEKHIHVKYIVGENGFLDVESDDEQLEEEEEILALKERYGDQVIEKIIRFHKYTNLEIDDNLDYLREISFVYLSPIEREEISTLYKRFKKRYVLVLLKELFNLLNLVIGRNKKKIASYFLFYVLSKTLQTLSLENSAKLYISSYAKMLDFKDQNFNLEEFLMFDNRPVPKIEKVLYNL